MLKRLSAVAAIGWAMSGCVASEPPGDSVLPVTAAATLRTPAGAGAGTVTVTQLSAGLRVEVEGVALPPGPHGLHIHTTGRCDAPDFTTAGPHWNPTARQHGPENPQGPHAGDLPNLLIGTDGRGSIGFTLPGATLAGLMDADGAAMVVHATADDMKTDPSGNSGARIACGVFG